MATAGRRPPRGRPPHRRRLAVSGGLLLTGLVVAGPLASPASAATLIAKWNMADTTRTMKDSSGGGHDGTSTSNVQLRQPGRTGYAYRFTSTPSYVTVPSSTALNPGTSSFSVTARIRFSSVPPGGTVDSYDIVRKGLGTTSGGDWKLEILGSGRAHCLFRGSAGQGEVVGTRNLADGAWHTIRCSRTATQVTQVVDGVSRSVAKRTGTISNSSVVRLGAKNTSGHDQYRGSLDEVSISKG